MGGFPVPTYALVGKRTMAKPIFPNMFSWKHGFLETKFQCTYNRNAHKNNLLKEPMNVACLNATITLDIFQQTSNAVAMTASTTSGVTNLALLPVEKQLESTFQMTHVQHTPANISTMLLSSPRKSSVPYKIAGYDEGDLHCALPIQGLLLDNNLHNNSKKEV